MATTRESKIQLMYGSTAGATPDGSILENGELAINGADGIIYHKDGKGGVISWSNDTNQVTSVNGFTEGITFLEGTNITITGSASGITIDAAGGGGGGGGTFAASYHGHIESVSNKTYYLDPRLAADRTITEFYAIAGTGGCTAELSGDGSSIGTMQVSTSGSTASLSNTGLSAGNTLELTLSDNSLCYDLRFAVRYEQ